MFFFIQPKKAYSLYTQWNHLLYSFLNVLISFLVSLSHVQLCNLMNCSIPGFRLSLSPRVCTNSCPLSQWCHPTISSSVLLPSIFPNIRVFSSESVLCIRWPNYWSFSFSISPSNEYSVLIFFRIYWFDLSKGLSGVFSSTTVWKHQFFGTQPSLWSNSHSCTLLLP